MSVGKFIAGFAIGALVGGVMGILLAPQSGEETREMLAEKSKELKDKATTTASEIHSKAEDVVDDIKAKGEEIVSKLNDMINNKQGV